MRRLDGCGLGADRRGRLRFPFLFDPNLDNATAWKFARSDALLYSGLRPNLAHTVSPVYLAATVRAVNRCQHPIARIRVHSLKELRQVAVRI